MSLELSTPSVEAEALYAPVDPGRERELKALLADLVEHSETLVRQEVELGKAELNLRIDKAKKALLTAAISVALYYAAYLTVLATLVLLMAVWVAPWIAALIVALLASAGAVVFTLLSRQALVQVAHPHEHPSFIPGRHAHT